MNMVLKVYIYNYNKLNIVNPCRITTEIKSRVYTSFIFIFSILQFHFSLVLLQKFL